ncbi:hypothetical protein P9112_012350 [Eukaryota sp. TZLM1-RC]
MSDTNQPRPSIRIESSTAQRRIPEKETGPSSSHLAANQAPVLPPSVEAPALPENSPPEGDISPKDSASSRGDNPPKDSVPSEVRSPSLVSHDDEDVEDSEATHPSSFRESEVPPSPHNFRSFEVPPSSSIQSIESVQPLHAIKEGTGVQPSSSQKDSEVPTSSPYSESEVSPSHQLPSVPTVRSSSQNPVVPVSGSILTSTAVRGVNNLLSPPQANDSTVSASNLPAYLSEEQRKGTSKSFQTSLIMRNLPRNSALKLNLRFLPLHLHLNLTESLVRSLNNI